MFSSSSGWGKKGGRRQERKAETLLIFWQRIITINARFICLLLKEMSPFYVLIKKTQIFRVPKADYHGFLSHINEFFFYFLPTILLRSFPYFNGTFLFYGKRRLCLSFIRRNYILTLLLLLLMKDSSTFTAISKPLRPFLSFFSGKWQRR